MFCTSICQFDIMFSSYLFLFAQGTRSGRPALAPWKRSSSTTWAGNATWGALERRMTKLSFTDGLDGNG